MRSILIAHQSSIPHYRIPFYNALENLRPNKWRFEVVIPRSEINQKKYFKDDLNSGDFLFPTLNVNTYSWNIGSRTLGYQTFWLEAGNYDLIIVEDAINNLTYPLCHIHKLSGTQIAYWGLGRDRKVDKHSPLTYLVNQLKLFLNQKANGYFAYTEGVKNHLISQGIPEDKIFTVNNTIDISQHRTSFQNATNRRESIRRDLGVSKKNVLLFVSTFKKAKRADFLLNAFSFLQEKNNKFHLLLVGSGGEAYLEKSSENITYFGSVVEIQKLAPIYVASDIFAYPGQVGLAPLQALCYDLPVITIDSHFNHGPEIEYLTPENSIILDQSTSPEEYARAITDLFQDNKRLQLLKSNTWPSIRHLTIEQMANNFIGGINLILEQ